jgi:hypothetical protein
MNEEKINTPSVLKGIPLHQEQIEKITHGRFSILLFRNILIQLINI